MTDGFFDSIEWIHDAIELSKPSEYNQKYIGE